MVYLTSKHKILRIRALVDLNQYLHESSSIIIILNKLKTFPHDHPFDDDDDVFQEVEGEVEVQRSRLDQVGNASQRLQVSVIIIVIVVIIIIKPSKK